MNQDFENHVLGKLRASLEELYQDLHDAHGAYCELMCARYRVQNRGQKEHTVRCEEMVRKYGCTQRPVPRVVTPAMTTKPATS